MFIKTATRTEYAIEVGVKRLTEILAEDEAELRHRETLSGRLDQIDGVDRANYDGHFGPFVFLRLDVENDNDETWAEIEQLIS